MYLFDLGEAPQYLFGLPYEVVFLAENVAGEYLSIVDKDDPELSILRDMWAEEE